MKDLPLISIIIPSYNKGEFVKDTLASVLAQSSSEWECIIVDDNSTDKSIEYVKTFQRLDPRISLIKKGGRKRGASASRNIGISHASGQYVIFLDADDVLTYNCLSDRLTNISSNPNFSFWVFPIGTFYKKIGDSSSKWIPKGNDFLNRFLNHKLPWHTMSVVWKKSFLEELGGFDMEYPRLQDVELHTRALLHTKVKYKAFPNEAIDCFYRIDENRITGNKTEFLTLWVTGAVMYVDKIGSLIKKEKNAQKLEKELRGTVLSTLTNLLYRKSLAELDNEKYRELKDHLLYSCGVKNLFRKKHYHLINLYEEGYKLGLYRVKGYNFSFQKLISL